jgi:hypothetical protein
MLRRGKGFVAPGEALHNSVRMRLNFELAKGIPIQ